MVQRLRGRLTGLCPKCRWQGPLHSYNTRIWTCSHHGVTLIERADGRLSTDTATETKLPGPPGLRHSAGEQRRKSTLVLGAKTSLPKP